MGARIPVIILKCSFPSRATSSNQNRNQPKTQPPRVGRRTLKAIYSQRTAVFMGTVRVPLQTI